MSDLDDRPAPAASAGLEYRPQNDGFDEAVDPTGAFRASWSHVATALTTLGSHALHDRAVEAERLIHADGATFNLRGGTHRPWRYDPVPHVLDSEDWATVESGLRERREVLDLTLADLYGDRTLLHHGVLPPELVLGQPDFIRAADRIPAPNGVSLAFHAADVIRRADGSFAVLADRTDIPSGAGYALENRNITLRLFPSLFRDSHVHRLSLYFRALRSTVRELAPPDDGEPRVVILTSGPGDPAYFEHTYLAAYLGWPLVEGADLAVRDGRVHLRSLRGLERVHVVIRRVAGRWCDPLELRPDSTHGVPGLLAAARRGSVSVLNPIGSAIVESPGLFAHYDALVDHFLGRRPRLATVPAWWCGTPDGRAQVLARLDEMVLKSVAPGGEPAVFCWRLTREERTSWHARLAAEGHRWVGQRRAEPSTTPTFVDGALVPRDLIVRTHAIATDRQHVVLPGGLARVSDDGSLASSADEGAVSKDTWIISSEPIRDVPLWAGATDHSADAVSALPSRAAENLFWLGRYSERVEQKLRLLRVIRRRDQDLLDSSGGADLACVRALTDALGIISSVRFDTIDTPGSADTFAIRRAIVGDDNPASVRRNLSAVVDLAHAVRELLSFDTWQVIGDLEDAVVLLGEAAEEPGGVRRALLPLPSIAKSLQALAGITTESFVRDDTWRFLDSGRRLERALLLSSVLDETLGTSRGAAADDLLFESVLVQGDSIMTYRSRQRGLDLAAILRLLVLDDSNPRSVRHALERLSANLGGLPIRDDGGLRSDQKRVLRALTAIRLADADSVAMGEGQPGSPRPALQELLGEITSELWCLADDLAATFFLHVEQPAHVIGSQQDAVL